MLLPNLNLQRALEGQFLLPLKTSHFVSFMAPPSKIFLYLGWLKIRCLVFVDFSHVYSLSPSSCSLCACSCMGHSSIPWKHRKGRRKGKTCRICLWIINKIRLVWAAAPEMRVQDVHDYWKTVTKGRYLIHWTRNAQIHQVIPLNLLHQKPADKAFVPLQCWMVHFRHLRMPPGGKILSVCVIESKDLSHWYLIRLKFHQPVLLLLARNDEARDYGKWNGQTDGKTDLGQVDCICSMFRRDFLEKYWNLFPNIRLLNMRDKFRFLSPSQNPLSWKKSFHIYSTYPKCGRKSSPLLHPLCKFSYL